MHYLLAGTTVGGSWPQRFLLPGDTMLPEVGDSEILFYSHAQVGEIAAMLDAMPRNALEGRFDAAEMTGRDIYAVNADEDDSYLMHHFDRLKPFVAQAAADGHDLLIIIC